MYRPTMLVMNTLFILTILSLGFNSHATVPQQIGDKKMPSLNPILKDIMPAIVSIASQQELPPAPSPRHRSEKRPQARPSSTIGSGVIVDASKGYILTNSHLIADAKTITVTLSDGPGF